MSKHHVVAKAQKRTLRNRKKYAEKLVGQTLLVAKAAEESLKNENPNRKLRRLWKRVGKGLVDIKHNLTAKQLRLRAVKRAKEARDGSKGGSSRKDG